MKNIFYFLLVALSLAFFSCDSFVEVELPDSQLTGATVFEDKTTLNAAMADVYAKLRDSGILNGSLTGGSVNFGLYTDELDYYGPAGGSISLISQNVLVASDPFITQFWNTTYNQVYGANAILSGISNSTSLPQQVRDQFRGEALFVRALAHFYLVNVFGDVPYITSTDYEQNRLATRASAERVYELITTDLNEAATLLPSDYITQERVRPNRAAAKALLARVYLYRGLWNEAANTASQVISDPLYPWEENIDNVFKKESTVTIWQFQPRITGANTEEGDSFMFTAGPPPSLALKESLILAFQDDDLRRTHWITAITDGTTTWYHANKYTQNYGPSTSVEYPIVLRLAEQYLIRAEAFAHLGNDESAKQDLNKIRSVAGLAEIGATSNQELITAILHERRLEFFTEHGHRFFDLKRTATINTVLGETKLGWEANDALWPIPANELLANPNLYPQNPGY
jgi:hypothetical protein